MKLSPKHLLLVALSAGFVSATAPSSHAGPWGWFGRSQPAYPVGAPVPLNGQTAYSPAAGYVPPSYAPYAGSQLSGGNMAVPPPAYLGMQTANYSNYSAAMPQAYNAPLLAPGFPQTVAGYLPTAAYDTQWNRTPVTYYRPVTAFDPRYGTTVTSLQPCTSYQYQAQRAPVIAPRPLLGEYGLQANKWPSITGPGYNPTGLAVQSMYPPIATPYQSLPNVGVPYLGQPTYAPMSSSGTSLGMPATSLPTTTLNYSAGYPASVPTYAGTANYLAPVSSPYAAASPYPYAVNPYAVNPYAAQSTASAWPNYTSNALGQNMLGTNTPCANGTCSSAAPLTTPGASPYNMPTPVVPGATSVVPYGPPTYSATPGAGGAPAPYGTMPGTQNYPTQPSSIRPNTQVLPGSPQSNMADPESTRPPGFGGGFGSLSKPQTGNEGDVRKLPMVAIDRGSNDSLNRPITTSPAMDALAKDAMPKNQFDNSISLPLVDPSAIPNTLPAREYSNVKPLSAPQDYDTKPRWNPMLLDPEDRTAMESRDAPAKTVPIREAVSRRIRLVEVEMPTSKAVAFRGLGDESSQVQFASGIETKRAITPSGNNSAESNFRPVTKLK